MDCNIPKNSVIFLGASNTQGLPVAAIACPSVNYGIGGDTSLGVLQRLNTYKSISTARAIVINIGGNDLKYRSNEELLVNLKKIATQIPRRIPIIINSIFPIDENIEDKLNGRNNKRIKQANEILKDWIVKVENIYYIDTGSKLIDENGNLEGKFHIGDGLHLNEKGYLLWIEDLTRILKSIDKNKNRSIGYSTDS